MHPSLGEASLEQHFSLITPSSWQGCLPLPLQPPSLCIRRLLPSSPYRQGEKGEISGPSAVRHNVCMCVAGTLFPPTHTLSLWPNSPPHCNQHLTLLQRLQWLTCHCTLGWVPRFRGKKRFSALESRGAAECGGVIRLPGGMEDVVTYQSDGVDVIRTDIWGGGMLLECTDGWKQWSQTWTTLIWFKGALCSFGEKILIRWRERSLLTCVFQQTK